MTPVHLNPNYLLYEQTNTKLSEMDEGAIRDKVFQ